MWLHLASRRICPSGNLTDVTLQRAVVVACAVYGMLVNVERVIIYEWNNLFDNPKDMFLPLLVTELCKRVNVLEEERDVWTTCDKPLDPLWAKGWPGRSNRSKKRNTRGEREGSGT